MRTLTQSILTGLLCFIISLAAQAEEYWVYVVRPGDTIWDLAEKHTTSVLNWQKLQRLNQLPDEPALTMRPGRKLRFPMSILKHQPASARIAQVTGNARLLDTETGETRPLVSGDELTSGDQVTTQAGSNLVIRFADGSELLVQSETSVKMDSLSAYGSTGMVDTRVRLQEGRVDTQVTPQQGPGSRYEIITPAAVAAVRGTDFRVSAEQATARSEVLGGKVAVSGEGASQLVPAGFGVVAQQGKPPAPPKKLLPPPDLSMVNTSQRYLPLLFDWQPLPGAKSWRFQVAPDAGFKTLLVDDISPTDKGYVQDLPDGDYVLRVRGIDEEGLEGKDRQLAFTVDARPVPPVLIGLVDGLLVRDPQPEFGWTEPEDIKRYRFELARDEHFEQRLLDNEQISGNTLEPSAPLQPGKYYWRMASIASDGEVGPYSDVQSFEYKAIPDAPALEAPAIGEDGLTLRWRDAGEGMSYRYQFARDDAFEDIHREGEVSSSTLALAKPASGNYYFRVQAIDDTGYAGPYGPAQRVNVPVDNYWPLLILLLPLL